jgi:ribosomal protein S18 acetylase RimI-like enzyme
VSATSLTTRVGTPADAAALAEFAARTFRDTFAADNKPEDMDRHEVEAYGVVQQGRELVDPDITTIIVEAGGSFAAFAQVRQAPAPACVTGAAPIELWRFYVARDWHGRGVAQDLMRRVEAEAIRRDGRTLWLGVWEHNPRAQAFYTKCGFVDVGTQQFVVGADIQTERVMARRLDRE